MLLYTFSVKDWNWNSVTEDETFLEELTPGSKQSTMQFWITIKHISNLNFSLSDFSLHLRLYLLLNS